MYGILKNKKYINEDNFKSEDYPRFLNYLIFKVKTNKIKKISTKANGAPYMGTFFFKLNYYFKTFY